MNTKHNVFQQHKFVIVLLVWALLFSIFGTKNSAAAANLIESWHYRVPLIDGGSISRLDNSFLDANQNKINCGHDGQGRFTDITAAAQNSDEGYPLYAVGDGTIDVVNNVWESGVSYGKYVELTSFGATFRYAHLAKIYVNQGQQVLQGDLIGLLGNTGNSKGAHLHWEAWQMGSNPILGYDGLFEIQNVEEFSPGKTNPCDWPGTITAESLDVNHSYHPENTSLDQGCPRYFDAQGSARQDGKKFVTLFDHSNCLGNFRRIWSSGSYNLDNAQYNFNDRLRSLYIVPGWSVKLYANADSSGLASSCRTVDMWNLDKDTYENSNTKIGFDRAYGLANASNVSGTPKIISVDNTSSFQTSVSNGFNMVSRIDVFDNSTCTPPEGGLPQVEFYEIGGDIGGYGGTGGPVASGDTISVHADPPFTGTRYGWHDTGKYNLPDYMLNKVTSVGVTPGWSIALFDGLDQTGPYKCVSSDDADLSDNTLSDGTIANDRAESLIVFNNGSCSGMDLPDLTAEEVFVSLTTGTTTFEILNTGQNSYTDWHFKNKGSTIATGPFYADLYINNTRYVHYQFSNVDSQVRMGFDDWPEVVTDSGWLRVRLVVDPDNNVTELDELNNVWEKDFFWNAPNFLETLGCSNVPDPGVILAQNAFCGGNFEYLLLPGTRNLTTLNENVSALRVLPGISVMVYKEANLSGQTACFSDNYEDVSQLTWPDGSPMNDSISSFEVFFNEYCIRQGTSVGQLVLYGDANYQGSATSFNLPGLYNLPSNVDNSTSSLDIASGWSVMLYDGYNQDGSSVCKNSDDLDFASDAYSDGMPLNNTISSIELFDTLNCPLMIITPSPTNTAISTATFTLTPTNTPTVTYTPTPTITATSGPRTISVPQDYSTISQAMEVAQAGETILVAAGTYNERFSIKSGVKVIGAGAATTTIRGDGAGVVVYVGGSAELSGFTITNSGTDNWDAGIWVDNASGVISKNIITGNTKGIVLYCFSPCATDPRITNNMIYGNSSVGLLVHDGVATITNNTITNNFAGISVDRAGISVLNNNVTGNRFDGINGNNVALTLNYNNFWNNGQNYSGATPGANDLSIDPHYVSPSANDYHINSSSSLIDRGTVIQGIADDIDNQVRPFDGNGDGNSAFDIGADEYVGPIAPTQTPTHTATVTNTPTNTSTATSTSTPLSGPLNTGLLNASSNIAQTGGDNNGYEVNAPYAYANDGLFAVDNNSGTNTNISCTNSGKDKHRFYNYGISLPGTAVIQGIEVRLDAKVDSASGSPKLCVQLSWDGGKSWTTAKSTAVLGTVEQTFMLGSATDKWGHAWTTSQLSNTNFRIRVIDVASSTVRDFSLDWIGVRVTYK